MKRLILLFAPVVLGLIVFVSSASATSHVYAYSTVGYDSATDTVTGYSYTSYPYGASVYYQPYVDSTIYDEDGNYVANNDFFQTEGGPATVSVGYHAVTAYYQVVDPNLPRTMLDYV